MEPTAELQKTLYAEMVSHIKETDVSVPFREAGSGTTRAPKKERNIRSIAARAGPPRGRTRMLRNRLSSM